jgi:hypothetical protein
MEETSKHKQFSIFHDWTQDTQELQILAICETEDGKFYFAKKTIKFPIKVKNG